MTRLASSAARSSVLVWGGALLVAAASPAQYDYHAPTGALVDQGMQAVMICNGLFVSERPLELIYEQELKLNRMPVLPPEEVTIDREQRRVEVGGGGNRTVPPMRAVYREGLGCVVMGPEQTFADVDALPSLALPAPAVDPDQVDWPDGDRVAGTSPPAGVDAAALERAWQWTLDRERYGHPSQITLSLLVVYRGQIVLERYAPGVDRTTRTRTWSTAKSIAGTLVGIAVGQGKLELDAPLPFSDWGTGSRAPSAPSDPRRAITLRHVLNMSSGLYPVDNASCATGSCLAYFGGASSRQGALDRGLVHIPGSHWDYENYDTLLSLHALETVLDSEREYLEFPRRALFDKIGMHSTLAGVDRFGAFVMSSQVYTNARDLARLGLLYLDRGRWNGEQIVPESWVDFVRTAAPATLASGAFYGGQFWLPPDDRDDVPADAYSTAGNRGQYAVIVPSADLVVVRRGLDWLPGQHGFSQWDLLREVLKAFPAFEAGEKLRAEAGEATGGR